MDQGGPPSRHALFALFAALTPLDSSFLALEMSLFELWTSPTSEADQSVGLGSAGQGRPYYSVRTGLVCCVLALETLLCEVCIVVLEL